MNVRAANFVTEGGIDVNVLATRLAAAEATISTLQSTVSTLQTALAAKLDSSAAASTYLTQATASSTYLRQSTASSTYLGIGTGNAMRSAAWSASTGSYGAIIGGPGGTFGARNVDAQECAFICSYTPGCKLFAYAPAEGNSRCRVTGSAYSGWNTHNYAGTLYTFAR